MGAALTAKKAKPGQKANSERAKRSSLSEGREDKLGPASW